MSAANAIFAEVEATKGKKSSDRVSRIRDFLQKHSGSSKARDENGSSVLHRFLSYKGAPLEGLRLLLNDGADPTSVDNAGVSVLHEAIRGKASSFENNPTVNMLRPSSFLFTTTELH
jgi:hypothetical protein